MFGVGRSTVISGRTATQGSLTEDLVADVSEATGLTRVVVEQAYRAFAARDIEGLFAVLSPDVEWGEPGNPLIPSAGMRPGIAGVAEWLSIGNETEDIRAFDVDRILVDGDQAAVLGHTAIVARTTGTAYETDFVHIVTVRDGCVTRFVEFFDTWAAAEAFRPPASSPATQHHSQPVDVLSV